MIMASAEALAVNGPAKPQAGLGSRRCKIITAVGVVAAAVAGGVAAAVVMATKNSPSNSAAEQTTIAPIPTGSQDLLLSTSDVPPTSTISTPTPLMTSIYIPEPTRFVECDTLPHCAQQTCSNGWPQCTECMGGASLSNGECYLEKTPTCPVVGVGSACYNDLATAINSAPDGGVVTVFKDGMVLPREIAFSKSLTIQGNPNSESRTQLLCGFNNSWGGMLRATGDSQTVTLRRIAFSRSGTGDCTAFRTPDLGTGGAPTYSSTTVNLNVYDCSFTNFETYARGGSAIFVGRTAGLTIDHSSFEGNVVHDFMNGTEQIYMFGGGGAVWIKEIMGDVRVTNTRFDGNKFWFKHSLGAAFFADTIYSPSTLTVSSCTFSNNMASAGGALHIARIAEGAKAILDSTFESNEAREFGWKARGGAVWLERIEGTAEIYGSFRYNQCPVGRGAAIANNILTGKAVINAEFIGNVANLSAVWDSWSSNNPLHPRGTLTISNQTTMFNNTAANGRLIAIMGGGYFSALNMWLNRTATFTSTGKVVSSPPGGVPVPGQNFTTAAPAPTSESFTAAPVSTSESFIEVPTENLPTENATAA